MNTYKSFKDFNMKLKSKLTDNTRAQYESQDKSKKIWLLSRQIILTMLLSLKYKDKEFGSIRMIKFHLRDISTTDPIKYYNQYRELLNKSTPNLLEKDLRNCITINKNNTLYKPQYNFNDVPAHYCQNHGTILGMSIFIDKNFLINILKYYVQDLTTITLNPIAPPTFKIFSKPIFLGYGPFTLKITESQKKLLLQYIDDKLKPCIDEIYDKDIQYMGRNKPIDEAFKSPIKINEYKLDERLTKILFTNHFSNYNNKRELLYNPLDYLSDDEPIYQYLLYNYGDYYEIFNSLYVSTWEFTK